MNSKIETWLFKIIPQRIEISLPAVE